MKVPLGKILAMPLHGMDARATAAATALHCTCTGAGGAAASSNPGNVDCAALRRDAAEQSTFQWLNGQLDTDGGHVECGHWTPLDSGQSAMTFSSS